MGKSVSACRARLRLGWPGAQMFSAPEARPLQTGGPVTSGSVRRAASRRWCRREWPGHLGQGQTHCRAAPRSDSVIAQDGRDAALGQLGTRMSPRRRRRLSLRGSWRRQGIPRIGVQARADRSKPGRCATLGTPPAEVSGRTPSTPSRRAPSPPLLAPIPARRQIGAALAHGAPSAAAARRGAP